MDKLDILERFIRKTLIGTRSGDFYDMDEKLERTEDSIVLVSRKCPMWEAAKALQQQGFANADFCSGHQLFYQSLFNDTDLPVAFRITKRLASGDDHCKWVFKLL